MRMGERDTTNQFIVYKVQQQKFSWFLYWPLTTYLFHDWRFFQLLFSNRAIKAHCWIPSVLFFCFVFTFAHIWKRDYERSFARSRYSWNDTKVYKSTLTWILISWQKKIQIFSVSKCQKIKFTHVSPVCCNQKEASRGRKDQTETQPDYGWVPQNTWNV